MRFENDLVMGACDRLTRQFFRYGWRPHRAPFSSLDSETPLAGDKQGPLHSSYQRKTMAQFPVELIEEAIHSGHLIRDASVPQLTCEICGIYLTPHVTARFLLDDQANELAQSAFERL
jgi:hypothetical protein